MYERLAERLIQEAMAEGKFDDLRGGGMPVSLDAYFQAPAEIRMTLAVLRDARFVPREVELLNEIADLKAACRAKDGSVRVGGDLQRLRRLELELGLLLERRASQRRGF